MELETQETNVVHDSYQNPPPNSVIIRRDNFAEDGNNSEEMGRITKNNKNNFEKCVAFQPVNHEKTSDSPMISYEKVKRHKQR